MPARILHGRPHAEQIQAQLRREVLDHELRPHLAIVLIGDDPGSERYVARKQEAAVSCGMTVDVVRPASPVEADEALDWLAADDEVHGIILQLPVPRGYDASALIDRIPPQKDVDGLRPDSPFQPAVVAAVEELLAREGIELAGQIAAVVGASGSTGRQLVAFLERHDLVPLTADDATVDLAAVTRQASLLLSATGVPHLITAAHVARDAVVVDVGFSLTDAGIAGDVDPGVAAVASALSPVPGGVGPLTVACLLRNTLAATPRATPPA